MDGWISTHFTQPYNILVEYSWRKHYAQPNSYSYPPKEEKVKPFLEAVQQMWLQPFAKLFAEEQLFAKIAPLRIYLYGSYNMHPIGVELIRNTSAPAIEMHLYGVNEFNPTNSDHRYILMRSLYHQMALRLTEVVPFEYDKFQSISQGQYTGDIGYVEYFLSEIKTQRAMYDYSPYALRDGFFTLYSPVSPRTEFAEILSIFFASTLEERTAAFERAGKWHNVEEDPTLTEQNKKEAERAVSILRAKEKMVNDYLRYSIKVPLIRIQRELYQARVSTSTPTQP